MPGIVLLIGFLMAGIILCEGIFARRPRALRLWFGLTAGLVLMMWLPSLFAFFMDFTRMANLCAIALAWVLAIAAYMAGKAQKQERSIIAEKMPPIKGVLALVLPFTVLFAVLQYTHYFREVDGALHVGQSTYGDLCMHSAIITSLKNASYPPNYSILPDTRLGYPFLMDALSASMTLFGTPLSLSMTIPDVLMGAMVAWGFVLLSWKMTHSMRASAVAFLLFFLNGGLGFLYAFDFVARDQSAVVDIFTGYYLAPANMPDLNLRWVNVICDMLLPQRTFLAGITMLLPALWLLTEGMREREQGKSSWGTWLALGVLAGALPMIHTHSFLALGLISAGAMGTILLRERKWSNMKGFIVYGALALALALPQLLIWTFPQTFHGGALAFWPGWVNNTGTGLLDETVWFWVKNVGPVFLLLIPCAVSAKGTERSLAVGAALTFVVANLVRFQTNLYDNNKIIYAAYLIMCPLLSAYLVRIFDRLKGIPGRAWISVCFLTVSLLSGTLSIGRELVSDYQIFSADEVEAAAFLQEETPEHCILLTGRQHNNFASVLAGRNVLCGPDIFLHPHGLNYRQNAADVEQMYIAPALNSELFEKYGVQYVLISSQERGQYALDEFWFRENCALVFENDSVCIYRM